MFSEAFKNPFVSLLAGAVLAVVVVAVLTIYDQARAKAQGEKEAEEYRTTYIADLIRAGS